jgi:hypothetical protein
LEITVVFLLTLQTIQPGSLDQREHTAPLAGGKAYVSSLFANLPGQDSLPVDFITNNGQWDPGIKFIARKHGLSALFRRDAIQLHHAGEQTGLGLVFEGSLNTATLSGEGKRSGTYNFFMGSEVQQWQTNVPTYGSLLYSGLYEGVDLRVRENASQLEYDLLLAPGADLEQVVIRAEGSSGMDIGGDGSLIIQTDNGPLRQTPPKTWQVLPGGGNRPVESAFRILDAQHYGFSVPERDSHLALVIDPGLEWSTYLGGSDWDEIHDVASANDGTGDVIAVGATLSKDFTGRPNAVAGFVTRFSSSGALVYKTILVGSDREWIRGVAVAPSAEPVVVGESYSPDYPTTPGAYDTTHGLEPDGRTSADAFITRLSATGDRLVYSSYLGTNEYDEGISVSLTPSEAVVLIGETLSPNFPTTVGAFDRTHNCCTPYAEGVFSARDTFVARLSANGSALEYSTYLGGFGDELPADVVVDAQGFVTLTGQIFSSPDVNAPNLPTTADALARNPVSREGMSDAFLTCLKLDGNGAADLKYSTFLAGDSNEQGYAVALDPGNPTDVLASGVTYSTTGAVKFPTTAGTLRPSSNSIDGFVMRFRFPATGGNLVWSTLFGGFDYEEVSDLAVDSNGTILLTGETRSFDFPATQGAFDRSVAISSGLLFFDAYIARISANGSQVLYGSYLGGSYNDRHTQLAVVAPNMVVVSGWTLSGDFPTTPGAHDSVLNDNGVGGVAPGVPFDGCLTRFSVLPDGDGDNTVAAPTLFSPANGTFQPTNTIINFDWSDVADPSGIDGYHIQLNQRPDFVCCNDWQEVWTKNSDWIATVRFDGPYYWRVQTADRSGNLSAWSEVGTFNSGAGVSTLNVNPPSVEGGNPSQGQVTLSSSAPVGGASVSLRSSNTAVATVPASVTISQGNNLANFTVTTRAVSTTTSVTITATYGSSSKDVTLTVMPTTAPPAAPALISPANNVQLPPNQNITFSWNAVAGAATYEIQIDDSNSFNAPLVVSRSGLTETQTSQTFTSERRFWWRVRGRTSGNTNGAWSSVRSFEIKRSAPLPTPTRTPTAALPATPTVASPTSTIPPTPVLASPTPTRTSVPPTTAAPASATPTRTASATPSRTPTVATDTVSIQIAEYAAGNAQLRVEATSSNASATLQVYITSTNTLIGTLRNEGGGRYRGDFSWPTNPQNITVRSNLGGSASRTVTLK